MGLSRKKAFGEIRGTIPAGGSLNLESIPIGIFKAAKYVIRLFNDNEGVLTLVEMSARKNLGELTDSVYNRLGDNLEISVNFQLIGSDAVLRFVNGEAFDVKVVALKHPIE